MYNIHNVPLDRLDEGEQLINPDVPVANLRALASGVITQAVRDLGRKRDTLTALEAFLWITGPEMEAWQDFAGVYFDVYKFILPRIREVKKILARRPK